jgi:UPF0716 protein FxsA
VFLTLLAIFIIVPLLELWVIFEVGSQIGYLPTFLALILISVTGAALAKQQGYRALVRIQEEVRNGSMPGDSLIDGALILAGALLLLTPGFLTDAVGLLVLLPFTRSPFRTWLKGRLRRAARRRTVLFWSGGSGPSPGSGSETEQHRKELDDR